MEDITRTRWTNEALQLFLESCISEVTNVGRFGSSLRKESWINLAKKLDEAFGMKLSQKQLKNQYDHLKAKYSAWKYLKNKMGNLWNPATNSFNLSNEEWNEFSKGHPKLKTLKNAPLLFPELCIDLFDGTSASGPRAWAPSASFVRSSHSFTSDIQVLENIPNETLPTRDTPNDSQPTRDNPNDPVSTQANSNFEGTSEQSVESVSRPKKKCKRINKLDTLLEETIMRFKVIVDKETNSHSLDACVAKLNTLGLDETDPIYCLAYVIFGDSPYRRECWLKMPSNSELLKKWITTTAKGLGYL